MVNKLLTITRYLPLAVLVLLGFILLVSSLSAPSDPDMGWHLQNGLYILQNWHLPTGDVYSWTMPNYPWVTHEWGADVLMALLNGWGGLWALVIFFAAIIASAFYIVSGGISNSRAIRILVAIIGVFISWTIVGVRPQMITLLGVAILLYLVFNWKEKPHPRWLMWLPPLFLLWTNLHGGFSVGFIILLVFGAGELLRHILSAGRKNPSLLTTAHFWALAKWSGLAFLATLVNPNGWRVYWELYQTFVDRDVLNRIMEWLPITLTSVGSYNMGLMVLLLIFLLITNRGRFDTTKLVLVVAIFIFSLTSWRHMPIFALTAVVLLAEQLDLFLRKDVLPILNSWLGIVALSLILFLAGSWQVYRIGHVIADPALYGEVYRYPYGAVEHLKANPPTHTNLFNEYGWGGYLIWQYPERKVFIDGRMAIWKDADFNIFDDLASITGVDKQSALATMERWEIDLVMIENTRPLNGFLSQLPDDWEIKYRDNLATIWEKI